MSIRPRCGRHSWGSMLLAVITSQTAVAAASGDPAEGCQKVERSLTASSVFQGDTSVFPPPQLEIRTPFEPTSFPSAGRNYLIYELRLQNFSDAAMKIRAVDVLDADAPAEKPILEFKAQQLHSLLQPVGGQAPSSGADDGFQLAGGSSAVAFFCLAFDEGAPVPRKLRHSVFLENAVVSSPDIGTAHTPLRVLAPPVSGTDWIAANGPSNDSHHRLGLFVAGGVARISRRYAIDWKQIRENASFSGDARDVHAYHAYGQQVLAVADGTVVSTRDGLPDNIPRTAAGFSTAVPITLETAAGNSVVLDLGGRQFAYYAHLQAGSLRVKKGDRVRRGQVLARIGNSGDAREPHLHFQLATTPDLMAAEGIPYLIDQYVVDTGKNRDKRTRELPVRGMLIDFNQPRSK
ncbi:M23 family metallopeptidase [Cystobacter ferrugineus]|nr:M23 family metallopeptidase [Cystobacter ferrugineus]